MDGFFYFCGGAPIIALKAGKNTRESLLKDDTLKYRRDEFQKIAVKLKEKHPKPVK